MAELFWLALGFILATIVWHQKFRDWLKSKIWRKSKPVVKEPDIDKTIVVKEVQRNPKGITPKSQVKNVDEHGNQEV